MKYAFHELINTVVKERIGELEEIAIETSKTEMQRERKEKRKKRKGKDRIKYSRPVGQLQMCSIHVMGNMKYI